MSATVTVEQNSDQTARITLTGYAAYAYVQPIDGGQFRVYIDDHLTGETTEVTTGTAFNDSTELAKAALLSRASADGIDVTSLVEVSD
jgi:hypothetical protein